MGTIDNLGNPLNYFDYQIDQNNRRRNTHKIC